MRWRVPGELVLVRDFEIICDKCQAIQPLDATGRVDAINQAKCIGWKELSHGQHLCPVCVGGEDGEEAKKGEYIISCNGCAAEIIIYVGNLRAVNNVIIDGGWVVSDKHHFCSECKAIVGSRVSH